MGPGRYEAGCAEVGWAGLASPVNFLCVVVRLQEIYICLIIASLVIHSFACPVVLSPRGLLAVLCLIVCHPVAWLFGRSV